MNFWYSSSLEGTKINLFQARVVNLKKKLEKVKKNWRVPIVQ